LGKYEGRANSACSCKPSCFIKENVYSIFRPQSKEAKMNYPAASGGEFDPERLKVLQYETV